MAKIVFTAWGYDATNVQWGRPMQVRLLEMFHDGTYYASDGESWEVRTLPGSDAFVGGKPHGVVFVCDLDDAELARGLSGERVTVVPLVRLWVESDGGWRASAGGFEICRGVLDRIRFAVREWCRGTDAATVWETAVSDGTWLGVQIPGGVMWRVCGHDDWGRSEKEWLRQKEWVERTLGDPASLGEITYFDRVDDQLEESVAWFGALRGVRYAVFGHAAYGAALDMDAWVLCHFSAEISEALTAWKDPCYQEVWVLHGDDTIDVVWATRLGYPSEDSSVAGDWAPMGCPWDTIDVWNARGERALWTSNTGWAAWIGADVAVLARGVFDVEIDTVDFVMLSGQADAAVLGVMLGDNRAAVVDEWLATVAARTGLEWLVSATSRDVIRDRANVCVETIDDDELRSCDAATVRAVERALVLRLDMGTADTVADAAYQFSLVAAQCVRAGVRWDELTEVARTCLTESSSEGSR